MTADRRMLIVGNWKMNGLLGASEALAAEIAAGAAELGCELIVCPVFPALCAVGRALQGSPVILGAQDCHSEASGAHTGDVSAEMLADAGCGVVIVGHSERRADHGEDDARVAAKAAAAHRAGLTAIICVGETESERDAGRTAAVVRGQVEGSLPASAVPANTVIAYEPIWAIGTGKTPTPDEVQAVHADIRASLAARLGADAAGSVRILYGGSVKPDNAARMLTLEDVDGALVGGASLQADSFLAIARAAG